MLSACASLGLRTSYVGTVARDENGSLILDALRRRGVDTSRAILRHGANPFAVILVADEAAVHGERIVLWKRPEEMALTPADLPGDVAAGARLRSWTTWISRRRSRRGRRQSRPAFR